MRTCTKCKTLKPITDFVLDKQRADGRSSWCKRCHCDKNIKYNDRVRTKPRRPKSDIPLPERKKMWRENNAESCRESRRKWVLKHGGTYGGVNPKLNNNIACRMRLSLKKGIKNGRKWEDLVGYSISDLRSHLESQFSPEMKWENHGVYWEIDHIIPVSAFNFDTPEHVDFKRCWSLGNLRPLEKMENRRKGGRVSVPFQPSLQLTL
jgi:hypothetical protein